MDLGHQSSNGSPVIETESPLHETSSPYSQSNGNDCQGAEYGFHHDNRDRGLAMNQGHSGSRRRIAIGNYEMKS